jgi:hypothetical protein
VFYLSKGWSAARACRHGGSKRIRGTRCEPQADSGEGAESQLWESCQLMDVEFRACLLRPPFPPYTGGTVLHCLLAFVVVTCLSLTLSPLHASTLSPAQEARKKQDKAASRKARQGHTGERTLGKIRSTAQVPRWRSTTSPPLAQRLWRAPSHREPQTGYRAGPFQVGQLPFAEVVKSLRCVSPSYTETRVELHLRSLKIWGRENRSTIPNLVLTQPPGIGAVRQECVPR